MKLLIAYASKSGCAREMAALLAEQLPRHEVTLCDLACEQPDPAAFDYADQLVDGFVKSSSYLK